MNLLSWLILCALALAFVVAVAAVAKSRSCCRSSDRKTSADCSACALKSFCRPDGGPANRENGCRKAQDDGRHKDTENVKDKRGVKDKRDVKETKETRETKET